MANISGDPACSFTNQTTHSMAIDSSCSGSLAQAVSTSSNGQSSAPPVKISCITKHRKPPSVHLQEPELKIGGFDSLEAFHETAESLQVLSSGLITYTDQFGHIIRLETSCGDRYEKIGDNRWLIVQRVLNGDRVTLETTELNGFVTEYRGLIFQFSLEGEVGACTSFGARIEKNYSGHPLDIQPEAARKAVEEARNATGSKQAFILRPVGNMAASYAVLANAGSGAGSVIFETSGRDGNPYQNIERVIYSNGLVISRRGGCRGYSVTFNGEELDGLSPWVYAGVIASKKTDGQRASFDVLAYFKELDKLTRMKVFPQLVQSLIRRAESAGEAEALFLHDLAMRVRGGDETAVIEYGELQSHRLICRDAQKVLAAANQLAGAAKDASDIQIATLLREAAFGLASDDYRRRQSARYTVAVIAQGQINKQAMTIEDTLERLAAQCHARNLTSFDCIKRKNAADAIQTDPDLHTYLPIDINIEEKEGPADRASSMNIQLPEATSILRTGLMQVLSFKPLPPERNDHTVRVKSIFGTNEYRFGNHGDIDSFTLAHSGGLTSVFVRHGSHLSETLVSNGSQIQDHYIWENSTVRLDGDGTVTLTRQGPGDATTILSIRADGVRIYEFINHNYNCRIETNIVLPDDSYISKIVEGPRTRYYAATRRLSWEEEWIQSTLDDRSIETLKCGIFGKVFPEFFSNSNATPGRLAARELQRFFARIVPKGTVIKAPNQVPYRVSEQAARAAAHDSGRPILVESGSGELKVYMPQASPACS